MDYIVTIERQLAALAEIVTNTLDGAAVKVENGFFRSNENGGVK